MSSSTTSRQTSQHSQHGKHRRRHVHNFPPTEYNDFTRTDLSLIAPVLLPKTPQETRSDYEKKIKKRIADLPTHLHCKLPILSSFCSLHSKLSPAPIISLFNSLRQEIEDEIPKTWGPLAERGQLSSQKREMVEIVQHLAVLWLGPKVFKSRFAKEPRRVFLKEKPTKCCACTLTKMGADFQTQVAMAGLFIGRIKQDMWENSKRVIWLMEWANARLNPVRRDDATNLMWEIGKKFRITRLGAEGAANPRKRHKLEEEEESEFGPGTASYIISLDRELREDRNKGPRRMIDARSQEDTEFQKAGNYRRARASSLYSCTTSGEGHVDISIAPDIDRIIALYNDDSPDAQDSTDDDGGSYTPTQYDDDNDPRWNRASAGGLHMSPSRIQSMLDRSFGGPWERDE